jgi:hypothetical protein
MRLPEIFKRCVVIALSIKTIALPYEFPDMVVGLFWRG